jgi:hypothetical protein
VIHLAFDRQEFSLHPYVSYCKQGEKREEHTTSHPAWPTPAQPLLDMYDAIFTKAKYARSEPDAEEYELLW